MILIVLLPRLLPKSEWRCWMILLLKLFAISINYFSGGRFSLKLLYDFNVSLKSSFDWCFHSTKFEPFRGTTTAQIQLSASYKPESFISIRPQLQSQLSTLSPMQVSSSVGSSSAALPSSQTPVQVSLRESVDRSLTTKDLRRSLQKWISRLFIELMSLKSLHQIRFLIKDLFTVIPKLRLVLEGPWPANRKQTSFCELLHTTAGFARHTHWKRWRTSAKDCVFIPGLPSNTQSWTFTAAAVWFGCSLQSFACSVFFHARLVCSWQIRFYPTSCWMLFSNHWMTYTFFQHQLLTSHLEEKVFFSLWRDLYSNVSIRRWWWSRPFILVP